MPTKFLRIILLSLFTIPTPILLPSSASAALITDVRSWSGTDHTRVVIDLTESVQYESASQENPLQFQLELKGVYFYTSKRELEVKDPFLAKVTLTDLGDGKARVIFYQKKALNVNVFLLKPYQEKPHRLVIDLVDVVEEKKEIEERQKQKEISPKGTKIIVIDPGHGGDDPGAIGPGKMMEKNVVLKVGEKVARLLNQQKDTKAFLTRKGDYFIKLEERRKIAEEDYKADLFVSLHADASFNPQARGSSVYCLSLSGATDEAAKILADKENRSNFFGGVTSKPITNEKDKVMPILVDLTQSNTMRESFRFAETVLRDLKVVNTLKYSSYRQANFIVLRAAKIPSVLIEMAYITNKEDERLLSSGDFQEKIAKAIASSVKKYFSP